MEKIEFELQIDSDARSRDTRPYLDHDDFIKYCNANGVYTNIEALEAYEKRKLLYPCFRLLYPIDLLKRRFRAKPPWGNGQYTCREEWIPLIKLESALAIGELWQAEFFRKSMVEGHPLEYAFASHMSFVVDPSKEKYKAWSRYNIVEGWYDAVCCKKNRAVQYYATWKIFFLDELNRCNTVKHNRATGQRSHWCLGRNELHPCSLNEYIPFFKKMAAFSHQYALLEINYLYNSNQTKADWRDVVEKSRHIARSFVDDTNCKLWIRFIRRLIELHENYNEGVRLIICEEIKRYLSRSVHMLRRATGYDFRRVCSDVSGYMAGKMGVGLEDGVQIYSDKLEEILADEKWDLEQSVGRYLPLNLMEFNKTLRESERIPEQISEQLFNALVLEPSKIALSGIRKMNRAFNRAGLYIDEDTWSGVCDLATSVEVHGKEWFGGQKLENVMGKLCSLYSVDYGNMKSISGVSKPTEAVNAAAFIAKLSQIRSSLTTPRDRRCGQHLLIAHLIRNYTSHQKGLSGKILREHLGNIYGALVNTFFVFYATHRKL